MRPIYIIILNYKKWQDTLECLESVFRSSCKDFSVIVVDNDSQNDSVEELLHWADSNSGNTFAGFVSYTLLQSADIAGSINPANLPRLTFIQNSINAGFAGGNNIALKLIENQDAYFWLLNPDMTIQQNTLEELVRFAGQRSDDAIIGSVVKSFSGNHELLFYGGAKINYNTGTINMIRKQHLIPKLDYISGACLFAHTSNLKRIGLLPEKYFLYWEETDWCHRARQAGCQFYVCPAAICYDKVSTVIGKSFLADYYYVRNALLFISKYRKNNLPFVLFFSGIRFLKRIFTGQWRRAGGVLKGSLDFFKMKKDEAE